MINALALQDAIEGEGNRPGCSPRSRCPRSASPTSVAGDPPSEKGRVVIFVAGMGRPFFTTDTPAALRAAEIEASAVLKGTHSGVNGVYSRIQAPPRGDPLRRGELHRCDDQGLRVMDMTAITFCRDNNLPVLVFDLMTPGNIHGALTGKRIGTLIS